jgi:hypothetical protein
MQNSRGRRRQILTSLGWGLLYALLGVAALLTGWSLLALLGIVPTTPPGGQHLSAADVASVGVASATLLLATVTVLLALFTRRSLELGRAELTGTLAGWRKQIRGLERGALYRRGISALRDQRSGLMPPATATAPAPCSGPLYHAARWGQCHRRPTRNR